VCAGSTLLLAEDESTSVVNGALVGVLLSQSTSPSVVCLSSPRSTYLGFLIEGKALLLYSSYLSLGVSNGLVIYHASSMGLKKKEFRDLRQKFRSVSEYIDEFTNLLRYAPDDIYYIIKTTNNQRCRLNIAKPMDRISHTYK
jgi:hypothetical protein